MRRTDRFEIIVKGMAAVLALSVAGYAAYAWMAPRPLANTAHYEPPSGRDLAACAELYKLNVELGGAALPQPESITDPFPASIVVARLRPLHAILCAD